jgi:hypothetical protein
MATTISNISNDRRDRYKTSGFIEKGGTVALGDYIKLWGPHKRFAAVQVTEILSDGENVKSGDCPITSTENVMIVNLFHYADKQLIFDKSVHVRVQYFERHLSNKELISYLKGTHE